MPDVQYPDDPISNPSAIRIEDLLGADDDAASSPPVPVREGLPRTFRMRADKHYVEMLDTPQAIGGRVVGACDSKRISGRNGRCRVARSWRDRRRSGGS